MEAVSRGAMLAGNSHIEGIIVPALFPNRSPRGNQYLNVVTVASDLMDRLTKLIQASNVFIALPGSVGTLGELALVWNHINIDFRVNKASATHLILWRCPFEAFIKHTVNDLGLLPIDIENIHFVDSPSQVVSLLRELSLL
jgi:predicted Rossmann-fold nucleotide-binding protein